MKRGQAETRVAGFEETEAMADQLLAMAPQPLPDVEHEALLSEVRFACTSGMLLCLDRPHRMAFVLGEILGLANTEAAAVLELEEATYRKRLQRARERMRDFMERRCGLVGGERAPCTCGRSASPAVQLGIVRPDALELRSAQRRGPNLLHLKREVEQLHQSVAVFRAHPDYAAPARVVEAIRGLLDSGRVRVLDA